MKLKMLIECPTKNVVYIFHNPISYMIETKQNVSFLEIYNYLDMNYSISSIWKQSERYFNFLKSNRVVVSRPQRKI